MNRYRKLIGNSVVFAIGNLGSKLIAFLLVPFYTFVLTKEQFGTVDIITTSLNLLLPLITLSVFDSVFRFALDGKQNHDEIFFNGLVISTVGAILGTLIIPILLILKIPMPIYSYVLLVSSAFLNLFLNFARSIGQVKSFALAGILGTIITAVSNVILLYFFQQGVAGYLLSMIIANVSVIGYLAIVTKTWTRINFATIDKKIITSMIKFSVPLIPNAFSWWINSSADKYFILFFIGASANGIYAVASKIPTLLNIVNQIFFQSWQISAVEEFESSDASAFYTKTFNHFLSFQFIGMAGIILILKPLMSVVVSPVYFISWKYIPFLLLTVVYSSLSGFLGTTYTASKKTVGIFLTTMAGAIANILFGFLFVPVFGLQGASFAGCLSFGIVLLIRLFDTRKFMPIHLDIKLTILNHVAVGLMIYLLFSDFQSSYMYLCEALLFGVVIFVNRSLLVKLLNFRKSNQK